MGFWLWDVRGEYGWGGGEVNGKKGWMNEEMKRLIKKRRGELVEMERRGREWMMKGG